MSTKPIAPDRQFSFDAFSRQNPFTPQPGSQLDNELNLILDFAKWINQRLGEIQRDDGQLGNGSVGVDQLKPALLKGIGVNAPEAWEPGMVYGERDTVFIDGGWYMCLSPHTSSDFEAEQEAGLWRFLLPTSLAVIGANSVFTNAIQNLAVTAAKLANGAVTSSKLADEAVTAEKLADGAIGGEKLEDRSITSDKLAAQCVSFSHLDAAVANRLTPIGMPAPWLTDAAPSGWVLAHGQNLSREAYSALFSVFGTKYGAGDGATTFGLPDLRGRMFVFNDAMGGGAAGRVTLDGSNIAGNTVGAVGGNQRAQSHAHHVNYTVPIPTYATKDVNDDGSGARDVVKSFNPTGGNQMWGADTNGAFDGGSQNMPPVIVANGIIYAGTGNGVSADNGTALYTTLVDGVTHLPVRIVVNDGVIGVMR